MFAISKDWCLSTVQTYLAIRIGGSASARSTPASSSWRCHGLAVGVQTRADSASRGTSKTPPRCAGISRNIARSRREHHASPGTSGSGLRSQQPRSSARPSKKAYWPLWRGRDQGRRPSSRSDCRQGLRRRDVGRAGLFAPRVATIFRPGGLAPIGFAGRRLISVGVAPRSPCPALLHGGRCVLNPACLMRSISSSSAPRRASALIRPIEQVGRALLSLEP